MEPYGVLRSWSNIEAVRGVIALGVLGGGWAIVRVVEPMPKTIIGVVAGVALGSALVLATTRAEEHPKGKRNLAYVLRAWEPDPEPQSRKRSKTLPPLPASVVDRGPRHKPSMVPPG